MDKKVITTQGMIVPIVAILVIIALGVFGFSYYKKDKIEETTTDATMNTKATPDSPTPISPVSSKIVTLSDNGFIPNSIEVNTGETVKFVNIGSGIMWVASAPHPEHTNYSEFDEETGVNNGQSYEFTFTKVGSWKYHNHLNPNHKGVVIVK
mgnify:CR=1